MCENKLVYNKFERELYLGTLEFPWFEKPAKQCISIDHNSKSIQLNDLLNSNPPTQTK